MTEPTRIDPKNYLIWSIEVGCWLGPSASGYTKSPDFAGRFTRAGALAICATLSSETDELLAYAVREDDLIEILAIREADRIAAENAKSQDAPNSSETGND